MQTQFKLLLKEQSDQDLHCLPFHLLHMCTLLYGTCTVISDISGFLNFYNTFSDCFQVIRFREQDQHIGPSCSELDQIGIVICPRQNLDLPRLITGLPRFQSGL